MAAYRVAVAEHNVKPYTNHPINSTNKNEQHEQHDERQSDIQQKHTHTQLAVSRWVSSRRT